MSVWHICGPLELERGAGGLQRGMGRELGRRSGQRGWVTYCDHRAGSPVTLARGKGYS